MATINEVNDIPPIISYVGSNGQDTYAYPFPAFEAKDVIVVIDGVTLILNTEYSVTGVTNDNGGNVILVTPTTGGEEIVIYRNTVVDRLTGYISGGDFLADTVNNDFDRIILMLQEANVTGSGRAIRAGISDTVDLSGLILPTPRDNNDILGFNADGTVKIILDGTYTTKAYVDNADAATLVSANSYTDNALPAYTYNQGTIDSKDAATLVSANSYTDSSLGGKANLSGDTFTGPVHFNLAIADTEPLRKGDITSSLVGATVQYVDDSFEAYGIGATPFLMTDQNDDLDFNQFYRMSLATSNSPTPGTGSYVTLRLGIGQAGQWGDITVRLDDASSPKWYVKSKNVGFTVWNQITVSPLISFLNATQEQCFDYLQKTQREVELADLGVQALNATVATNRGKSEAYLLANPITFVEPAHDLIDLLP